MPTRAGRGRARAPARAARAPPRRPRAGLDADQGGPGLARVAVEDDAGRAGLHAHDADVVGHDVVQLPGDPDAFGEDGAAGVLVAFAAELDGALLEQCLLTGLPP